MFEIQTNDPDELKRITVAGILGILFALGLVVYNLVFPFLSGGGYTTENAVFGMLGAIGIVLAAQPTLEAARRLSGS